MPRFSIILPFYNAAQTLQATLDALQAQRFDDWEAICVDDGSTDASAEIVARVAQSDPRFRQVSNPGKGPSDARNHAADLARADLLAFCDADDLWLPEKLAQMAQHFDSASTDAAYGQIRFFQDQPGDCPTVSQVRPDALTILDLLSENPVCTMSNLVVRRDAFLEVGAFDPSLVHNEDLDLLIRLVGHGKQIIGLDALQVWYRTSATGLSSDLHAMRRGRDQAIATAARFGVTPTPKAEAVYMRYLARRALRLDAPKAAAWGYTREGVRHSASGFLFPLRRGAATAAASAVALVLPSSFRRALFAR